MPIRRICENCDGIFYIKPHVVKIGKAHFCSRPCYDEAIKKGWNNQWVGKNHPCYGKPKPIEVRIKISKSLMGEKNPNYGKPKSKETLKKMREAQADEKHWNWKDGISGENLKIRNSNEYRRWRRMVFERDNYTCQRCLDRNGFGKYIYFHAHHILSFADFPEERLELNNGATLCIPCHDWIRKNELSA